MFLCRARCSILTCSCARLKIKYCQVFRVHTLPMSPESNFCVEYTGRQSCIFIFTLYRQSRYIPIDYLPSIPVHSYRLHTVNPSTFLSTTYRQSLYFHIDYLTSIPVYSYRLPTVDNYIFMSTTYRQSLYIHIDYLPLIPIYLC